MNDPTHPRRRRQRTIGTMVATAVVAYGTYRLARWYFESDDGEEECEQDQQANKQAAAGHSDVSGDTSARMRQGRHESRNHDRQGQHNQQQQQSWSQHATGRRRQIRMARMSACRQQASQSLPAFGAQFQRVIEAQTNVTEEKRLLKQIQAVSNGQQQIMPEQQQGLLWEAIKVKSFTLAIATAYAHVIVFLSLTVSTHVVFGWQDRQERSEQPESGHDESMDVADRHRFVLHHVVAPFLQNSSDNLHDSGLYRLVQAVQEAVSTIMFDWNVRDPAFLQVTPTQVDQAVEAVWNHVDLSRETTHDQTADTQLMRFLISPASGSALTIECVTQEVESSGALDNDDMAQSMLNETLDILESPICRDAQRDCVCACIRQMQRKVFNSDTASSTPHAVPLAGILTRLRKHTTTINSSSDGCINANDYVTAMESLPSVLELCNISFE